MHDTRQSLLKWFWAAYLVTSETPGMSALQFRRQLGIKRYETAFMMLHKLRAGMIRPGRDPIGAKWPVQVDETLVGGRTKGEGRGIHHKVYVIGAVEVRVGTKRGKGQPSGSARKHTKYAGRIRLRLVPDRAAKSLEPFVTENVARGARVSTDGWHGYDGLAKLGYTHEVSIADEQAPPDSEAWLPMIHLVFSNLKTWLRGTHHGVSQQHLQAYLNEYVFRFNRRFYPMTAFHSVLGIGTVATAPTYDGLYHGGYVHPNPTAVSGQ
jgi:transposase-like protein